LVFQGGALYLSSSLSSTLDREEKFLLLKHGKKVAMDLQTFTNAVKNLQLSVRKRNSS
jgi:hypothetical protein